IAQAFRVKAKALHPDVNADPATADRFQLLVEANAVLSDPEQRRAYDAVRAAAAAVPPPPLSRTIANQPVRKPPAIPFGLLLSVALVMVAASFAYVGLNARRNMNDFGDTTRVSAVRVRVHGEPYVRYIALLDKEITVPDPTPGAAHAREGSVVWVRYE